MAPSAAARHVAAASSAAALHVAAASSAAALHVAAASSAVAFSASREAIAALRHKLTTSPPLPPSPPARVPVIALSDPAPTTAPTLSTFLDFPATITWSALPEEAALADMVAPAPYGDSSRHLLSRTHLTNPGTARRPLPNGSQSHVQRGLIQSAVPLLGRRNDRLSSSWAWTLPTHKRLASSWAWTPWEPEMPKQTPPRNMTIADVKKVLRDIELTPDEEIELKELFLEKFYSSKELEEADTVDKKFDYIIKRLDVMSLRVLQMQESQKTKKTEWGSITVWGRTLDLTKLLQFIGYIPH